MNRSLALLAALCLLLGPLAATDAAVWHRTPDDVNLVWLGPGLDNNGTPQRDVYLDFSVDHTLSEGPIPNSGDVYSGTHDSSPVWDDDSVAWENILRTTPSPEMAPSPTESWVIYRNNEDDDASISITLGNLGEPNATKEIWIEWVSTSGFAYDYTSATYQGIDYYPQVTSTATQVSYDYATPKTLGELYATFADAQSWFDGNEGDWNSVKDVWYVHNVLVRLSPSPDLETIEFDIPAYNDDEIYCIDTIHVATNAIPEPGALVIWSALAAVAVGLAGWRPVKS